MGSFGAFWLPPPAWPFDELISDRESSPWSSHCLEGSPFSSKRAGRAGSGSGLRSLRAPTPEQGYCLAKSSRSLEIGLGKAPAFGASCMSLVVGS